MFSIDSYITSSISKSNRQHALMWLVFLNIYETKLKEYLYLNIFTVLIEKLHDQDKLWQVLYILVKYIIFFGHKNVIIRVL